MSYSELVEIRDEVIDGETNWMWVKGDTGSFNGPRDDWETHKTKFFKHVKNYDVIVTAGANCGMYSRLYSKMFKHVYAFEPDPLAFFCMVNNCQADNVIKLNAALGHGHGMVGIQRATPGGPEMNVGMNVITNPSEEYQIPMLTVDSLGLQACDVIQLDVEGFEQYALQGASQTIQKFKPVIIAERFGTPEHEKAMKGIGYQLVDISCMDAIYISADRINSTDQVFVYQVQY